MFRGQRFLALHAHQGDTFIHRHPILTEIACWVYETLQRYEGTERNECHDVFYAVTLSRRPTRLIRWVPFVG
jgi:hypothetical protein